MDKTPTGMTPAYVIWRGNRSTRQTYTNGKWR